MELEEGDQSTSQIPQKLGRVGLLNSDLCNPLPPGGFPAGISQGSSLILDIQGPGLVKCWLYVHCSITSEKKITVFPTLPLDSTRTHQHGLSSHLCDLPMLGRGVGVGWELQVKLF